MNGRSLCLFALASLAVVYTDAARAQSNKSKAPQQASASSSAGKSPRVSAETSNQGAAAKAPRSPSEEVPPPSTAAARTKEPAPSAAAADAEAASRERNRLLLISGISIFVLSIFVGFEVISKVPATLHTPLMSGSNAISGITVVGAIIAAAAGWGFSSFLGLFAVILAMVNVVGGFLVTHRMLLMFKRK